MCFRKVLKDNRKGNWAGKNLFRCPVVCSPAWPGTAFFSPPGGFCVYVLQLGGEKFYLKLII